jgi:alkylation response protein AidB-like acyl-CoA dehydrogenase
MRARSQDGGYVLDGTKLFVYDGHCADTLITAVRTDDADGVSLVVVDATAPGVSARRMKGFLSSESEVRFDNVEVQASAMLGAPGSGQGALDRALLKATPILCAYKVGGSQAVYDLSVEYSRERKQFGQPIGRFQHVQNHIVQLVNNLDAARWTTYEVLWKLDSGKPDAEVSMHLAKAVSSEAYIQATNYAHEVHAGVGVMREYGLTLFTQLSRSLYHALGDPAYHQRKLGDLLVDYMPEAAG